MSDHQTTTFRAEKLLYTPEEAAQALGISRSSLYLLLGDGSLESVRLGSRRRIRVATLERFVDSLTATAPSTVTLHS